MPAQFPTVPISLRSYQQDAVDAIRAAYRNGKRAPLYVAPTGSGKTITFSYMAQASQAKGNRVIIMVHRQELIHQICVALSDFSIRYGIIKAGQCEQYGLLTQVASVQSLARRLDRVPEPAMLIVDEAHHSVSPSYASIFEAFRNTKILGATATPQRLDGRGLGNVFDTMVLGPSVSDLIEQGFLARPVYYAPPSGVSTENLHIVGGDFDRAESEAVMDKAAITGSLVENYTKLCPGKSAIAFTVSLKHAESVRAEFCAAGYRAESIDGTMSDKDRRQRTNGLLDGTIQILVSVDLLGEGFDAPGAEVGIMARPTASLALWRQQVGRILRPFPGKERAILLDHTGNCLRHGFAESPIEWTLDPARPKKATEKVFANRVCPQCFRTHAWALACPECHYVYQVKPREIAEREGELTEITAEELEAKRLDRKREEGMARDFPALLAIEKARGYKNGWASMRWKSRRGMNPPMPKEAQLL